MCKSLLVEGTGTLDDFRQRVEHLTGHSNSFEEVGFAGRIYQFFAGVVPVEVHDGFLMGEECSC